jgi:hypothetical protein
MSTSPIGFRRRVRRGALALIVGAICLSPASALAQGDTKTDYPGSAGYIGTHFPVAPKAGDTPADSPGTDGTASGNVAGGVIAGNVAQPTGDNPADFPGMPGSPVVEPVPEPAASSGGFDWTSAAVGAGGAGLLIVVSLGGAAAASRMRMRMRTVRS